MSACLYTLRQYFSQGWCIFVDLKGLSHYIFGHVCCPVCREGLVTESAVLRDLFKLPASFRHANFVEEYSQRTEDSCQSFSKNRGLSCQSFSEIRRISEKVWTETHQNLNQLTKIKGAALKFKNRKRFTFRPRYVLQAKKQAKKSHATVLLNDRKFIIKTFIRKKFLHHKIYSITPVPDHDGGRPKEINARFLYTHMVYL